MLSRARAFFTAGLLCLVVLDGMAQGTSAPSVTDDPWFEMANVVVEHAGLREGLPHAIATGVTEGRDGAIWVGTQDGLARWDGYQFHTYAANSEDPHALHSNFIRAVAQDSLGRVWAGLDGAGVARYDEADDNFSLFDGSATVVRLSPDADGGMWLATTDGLVHVHRDDTVEKAWSHDVGAPDALPDRSVNAVVEDRHGGVWIGGASGLLLRFVDGRPGRQIDLPSHDNRPSDVQALFEDPRGRIWIGTVRDGVFVLDPANGAIREVRSTSGSGEPLRETSTTAFVADGHGHVWIGTQSLGVVMAGDDSLRAHIVSRDNAVSSNPSDAWVWGLHADRNGQIWIASVAGISRTYPQQAGIVTLFASKSSSWRDPYVFSVDVDTDGVVRMGQKSGVEVIDPRTRRLDLVDGERTHGKPPAASNLVAIVHTPEGRVYAGSRGGLFSIAPGGHELHPVGFPAEGYAHRVDALMLREGTLWIGSTTDGLWRMAADVPGARPEQVVGPRKFNGASLAIMAPARDGALWIGTGDGVALYEPGKPLTHVDVARPGTRIAGARSVNAILTDKRGRLWAGTNEGIAVLSLSSTGSASVIRHIGLAEGLDDLNIDALLEDDEGRIWASTDNGVAVIDPATLAVRVLHAVDGLAIHTYWVGSGAKAANGDLFFGGLGGLTVIHPSRLQPPGFTTPVVVAGVTVGSRKLAPGQIGYPAHLTVPADDQSFSVDFSAVDFTPPQHAHYRYRLVGFDKAWREVDGAHRSASYTNLPPGRYELQVTAVDRYHDWTERPLTMSVEVWPTWFQSWWFLALKILSAVAIVAVVVVARGSYLQRRSKELEALVARRTEDLAAAHRRLEEIAYIDAMTSLPNRRLFNDQCERMLASSRRQHSPFALLLLDLDHFKQINDTHGHDAGDALLMAVATRLRELLRQYEFVARLGGDEFAILLSDQFDGAGVESFCQRMMDSFREPVIFKGVALHASPSVGVAQFPIDGSTQDELYKSADVALYAAKRAGRRTWRFASQCNGADHEASVSDTAGGS